MSVDFPTRIGRRMHWILVLESGKVHAARIYSRSTYFASPPLPLPSIFCALSWLRTVAPNIHPNVDGEVAYAAPINGLAVGYIQV